MARLRKELAFECPGVKNQLLTSEVASSREQRKLQALLKQIDPEAARTVEQASPSAATSEGDGAASKPKPKPKPKPKTKLEPKPKTKPKTKLEPKSTQALEADASGGGDDDDDDACIQVSKRDSTTKPDGPAVAQASSDDSSSDDDDDKPLAPPLPKKKAPGIDRRNRHGETRLVRATVEEDAGLVAELIGKGADVNLPDNAGWSALHDATLAPIAKLLLEAGADVDAFESADKNTPLHEAARANNIEVARLMLQHHANPNTENRLGQKPAELATEPGLV